MSNFTFKKNESIFHKVEFSRLTALIDTESVRLHAKFSTQLVKQIVLMLRTLSPSTRIRELTSEVTQAFQHVIEKIHQEFCGETRIAEMQDDIRKTGDRQEMIRQDAVQCTEDVRLLKGELDDGAESIRPANSTWKKFQIVLFTLLGLDVLFNFKNFAVLGMNNLVSVAASGLIAIGLYFYVDQIPSIINKIHQRYGIRKVILYLLSFTPPVGLFQLLGTLRVQYTTSKGELASSSTIAFVGINSFILLVALLIVYRYKLSKTEKERFDIYNNIHKKIKKEEKVISQMWDQHQQLGQELRARNTIRYNAFKTIASMERQVELNYSATCSDIKAACLFKSNGKATFLFENKQTDFPTLSLHYQNLPELFQNYASDREVFSTPNSENSTNKLLLILLPLIVAFSACTQPKTYHTKLLPDMTDSMQALEQFVCDTNTPLLTITQLHNPQDQHTISVDYVSDRNLAEDGFSIVLPKGKGALLDNDIERDQQIDSFLANSNVVVEHIKKQKIGRSGSYIFYHLHRCLNELIDQQNDFSSLYIFTDGMEQSPWFNLYDSVQFKLFTTNAVYRRSILDQFSLDSLKTGKTVELHFVYQGKEKAHEVRFHAIISAIVPYYHDKGIHVFAGRSISSTKPVVFLSTSTLRP